MALKDLMKNIGGMFSRVTADMTRRPDGGTSHYRPLRKKTTDPTAGQMMPDQGETQKFSYVHTGFTGMNPPTGYGYEPAATMGQPTYFRQQDSMPPQDYVGKGSFSGQTAFQPQQRDNISYMPGFAPNPENRMPVHVEHIITLTGLKSCYDAIECMKDGETLIVLLDAIANESESIRCQDMLAGAAFTLGCHVRMLHGARLVLIVPEGVQILPEEQSSRAEAAPVSFTPPTAPREGFSGRRERRTGTNPDWNAARSGEMNNYNPYTGSTPVAAGAYSNFGGYGY